MTDTFTCNECGGTVRRVHLPCPEGREGCCVAHVGYRCGKCGLAHRSPKWTEEPGTVSIAGGLRIRDGGTP